MIWVSTQFIHLNKILLLLFSQSGNYVQFNTLLI